MVNQIVIQGRLTKDPEVKQTQSGISVLLFTVAWSEKYKETETKCFLLCKAWRQTAEFIGKYFAKGQEIAIAGHMVTEEWKEGEAVTLCLVDKAHFCGPKSQTQTQKTEPTPQMTDDDFMNIDTLDEELPFA